MLLALLLPVIFLGVLEAREAYSTVCEDGTGVPPFVGTDAVDPNVLLMIDNSASMYDLAAVGAEGICYDDSYSSDTVYSGYFRTYIDPNIAGVEPYLEDAWYEYDLSAGRFVKSGNVGASNHCNAVSGTKFSNDDVCVTMINTGTEADPVYEEVTAFAARGNFLNWAAASKMDIQKKVLTGGKYDDTNDELILESRGCLNHRYVKKTAVQTSAGATKNLTLGIKRDDADMTQIEIFEVTESGFIPADCQAALEEMASPSPSLGVLKGLIDDCLEQTDAPTTLEADSNAIFNQTTQDCWFMTKHGLDQWEQTNENLNNLKNGCEKVYAGLAELGDGPDDIERGNTGFACFGINLDPAEEQGYIGRCWNSGQVCNPVPCAGHTLLADERCDSGGFVEYCSGQMTKKGCNKDWLPLLNCVGEAVSPGWDEDNPDYADSDECVHDAILDYCGYFTVSEVIDPSDQEGSVSGDFYNAPAILIEAATEAQLDKPLLTMNGRIHINSVPEGILDKNAKKFRFGAMGFNNQGQGSECDPTGEENLLVECDNTMDGARVISYLDIDDEGESEHIDQLTDAINIIKGTTWTPLAEAMYTAIGYFSQDTTKRLNPSDFLTQDEVDIAAAGTAPAWEAGKGYSKGAMVSHNNNTYIANSAGTSCAGCAGPESDDLLWSRVPSLLPTVADPIEAYCQSNNVIYITEGASTVDIAPDVVNFVTVTSDADTDSGDCGRFNGSSYLDDLTWYGWQGNMWGAIPGKENYSNIRSWIVESATREITGVSGECQPGELLTWAARNGSAIYQDENTPAYTEKLVASSEVEFRAKLQGAFDFILDRVFSGSASSVVSASRSGEGALYQAIFWPDKKAGRIDAVTGEEIYVKWTGEVHAFLVDSRGVLFMDDCKDGTAGCETGRLDEPFDSDNDGILDSFLDNPIVVYGDEIGQTDTSDSSARNTKGCPGSLVDGEIVFFNETNGACLKTPIALEDIEYLWSTSEWLNSSDVEDLSNIQYNRQIAGVGVDQNPSDVNRLLFRFDSGNTNKRFVFTWNDLDNDGVVDYDNSDLTKHELRDFEAGLPVMGSTTAGNLPTVDPADNRGPVPVDFGVDPNAADAQDQVNNIIKWVRGEEISGLRERLVPFDRDASGAIDAGEYAVWKLGDIMHSTPISVSTPAENYHQLYRDFSYADFIQRWGDRRHMIYFGANDGMLHAVNGGFFDAKNNKFCREKDCGSTSNTPPLGVEMWAYVPYNLLPHLSCLTDPEYKLENHKYFVDLRPRIFDVQIFTPESACTDTSTSPPTATPLDPGCIHPNGWGTILVGGMRFGGAKFRPSDYDDDGTQEYPDDNREFTSSYFIFDITDPERVPTLLGEFTRTIADADGDGAIEDFDGDGIPDESPEVELGYTTVISTMVPMKRRGEDASQQDTDCDGDLSADPETSMWYLILGSGPTELDGTSSRNGSVSVVPLHRFIEANLSDTKRNMRIPAALPADTFDATGHPWNAPISSWGYPVDERGGRGFGTFTLPDANSFISDLITVDMEIQQDYLADVVYFGTVSGTWGDWGGKMYRLVTRKECGVDGLQALAQPSEWVPALLFDADKPIVASPTVGTDGFNFWVYFGTGRFFDLEDKIDSSSNAMQTFYGIREPISASDCRTLTWAEVLNADAPSMPYTITTAGSFPQPRGELGLLRTDQIGILSTNLLDQGNTLFCKGDIPDINGDYNDETCLPNTVVPSGGLGGTRSFRNLVDTISGTSFRCGTGTMGTDGWYRNFPYTRERNLGQASLLGGLTNYTTYQPYEVCLADGLSYLHSVYYRTGTAWIEDVFGNVPYNSEPRQENPDRVDLGKGLTTTPNFYLGKESGGKVFVQTSTGRIVEIPQPNLPEKDVKSGRVKWRDIEQ
jgi:type IV pilus assembly protein PilY1